MLHTMQWYSKALSLLLRHPAAETWAGFDTNIQQFVDNPESLDKHETAKMNQNMERQNELFNQCIM